MRGFSIEGVPPMPPRALVASVLLLTACLALAVVMLAILSAESDQSLIQEPPEAFAADMRRPARAGPCERTVPKTDVAEAVWETGSISQC